MMRFFRGRSIAFRLIWPPQVGPTELMLTCDAFLLASFASAAETFWSSAVVALAFALPALAWTSTVRPPRISTVAPFSPADWTAAWAWLAVTDGARTSQEVPPWNSMPRLRPRVPSEMTPARMTIVDAIYHHLRRPMNGYFVSPRYSRCQTFI